MAILNNGVEMKYLVNRGTKYYYRRNVPTELREVIGKKDIWKSLKTDVLNIAAERYALEDRHWAAVFASYQIGATGAVTASVERLTKIVASMDQRYVPASSKADLSDAEKLADAINRFAKLKVSLTCHEYLPPP